ISSIISPYFYVRSDKEKCNVSLREYKSFLLPTLMVGFFMQNLNVLWYSSGIMIFAINQQPDQQTRHHKHSNIHQACHTPCVRLKAAMAY
ncbi:TPA: hypothetical protein ACPVQR_004556, partial [Escherichia coli]